MFDISLAEIAVIGVVALVIIGPKKLPEVARFAGYWLGKVRRMIANAKSDMNREFKTDDLRNLLTQQQGEMQELRKIFDETRSSIEADVKDLGINLEDKAIPDDAAAAPAGEIHNEVKPGDTAALPAASAPLTAPHDGSK
ncbi:MAG: Sec-independent protein translocase protein TatB [Proteobacteria bacterium]|nr:Sec-independent protein translocase protein TatB [Pseudomonadota bacterium]